MTLQIRLNEFEQSPSIEPGTHVFVNEPDGSEGIVLATPDVRADEFQVPGTEKTVADYNDCSPDDSVIQVVFIRALEKSFGTSWTTDRIVEQFDNNDQAIVGKSYAYPESRLTTDDPCEC